MNCHRCGTPMQGMLFVSEPENLSVFNALTQTPKESLTSLSEFHSCWHLPVRLL